MVIKLVGENAVEVFNLTDTIGLPVQFAIFGAQQGNSGKQYIGGFNGQASAQPEALGLGAERTLDGFGLIRSGAFE
ncbi:MAG: hypothetical protein MO846_12390 [Candidatus Devosia symbiotica]|nr:hypothetical protein [Candidatus Devosia symbiotica]